jgi:hypothetical protein
MQTLRVGRRPEGAYRQGLEVLHNGGEMEFVARAGKTSQPHAFEPVLNLEMSEAHLDTPLLVA